MSLLSRRSVVLLALIVSPAALAAQSSIPTIRIGTQEWMRDNLAVTHFRNGDGIPTFPDSADWVRAGKQRIPAWVSYGHTAANQVRYGLLYNHYAVTEDGRAFSSPTALAILLFDYADTIFRIDYPQEIGQSVRCVREQR